MTNMIIIALVAWVFILSVQHKRLRNEFNELEKNIIGNVDCHKKDRDALISALTYYYPNFNTVFTLERNTKRPLDISKRYYIFMDFVYSGKEADERIAELVKEDKTQKVV